MSESNFAVGARVLTEEGVGTVKRFQTDNLGGWVTVRLDNGTVHYFEGAYVRLVCE